MSQSVTITTQGKTDQETIHKQDANKSLKVVYRKSARGLSMYNVNTSPRTTPLVLGGPMPQHATKTVDKSHTATVSHGCARSLLKPCSTNSNRSIDVVSSWALAASRLRSTLSAGPHAALRLVPIVLTLRVILACSSQHRHHCRIPY